MTISCGKYYLPITFFLLLVFFASNVRAVTPQVQISARPQWVSPVPHTYKKPTLSSVSGGFFYSLWDEQIHVEKAAIYNHIIREIVTEAGIQNGSSISVNFDPAYESLEFHQLTVWRNNKPIQRLSKSAFKVIANEEEIQRFLYHGTYSALLILEDIRKGDRIEYAYTLSGQNPIFENKFSRDIYFQGYEPIGHIYASVLVPRNRQLSMKAFNKVPKVRVSEQGGFKRYEWETFQTPAVSFEDYQPSWQKSFAYLQISEYKNWAEVANWAIKVNPLIEGLKGDLAKRVNELLAESGGSKLKFFRSAVRLTQEEVRYMGIETGEYSHRANHPEKVFDQRYGDCKDKSLLLASILKAGGINAQLALINTYSKHTLPQFLPTPKAFNHVVVVALIDGRQVWVDPTIYYQGGTGTDIYFPDYGKALIVQKNNNSITTLPVSAKGKVVCKERYSVKDEKSEVRLNVETKYTLQQADYIRNQLASTSFDQTVNGYTDYYSRIYPNIRIKDTLVVNDDIKSNEIVITESYIISDFFEKDSITENYVAGFYGNYINDKLPSFVPGRKSPVAVNNSFDMDHSIEVVLNSGWNILEEHSSISRYAYQFNRNIVAHDSVLSINYKFMFIDDQVRVPDLVIFSNDIKKMKNDLSYTFSYHPGFGGGFRINYLISAFSMLFLAFLAYVAVKLYKTRTSPGEEYLNGDGLRIGGWLYFITFGISVSIISIVIQLFSDGYFGRTLWEFVPATTTSLYFKGVCLFELSFNLLMLSQALFCLYLIYKRRDILPKVIIWFYALNACGALLDYILVRTIVEDSEEGTKAIVQAITAAVIWIPYFMNSSRVKQTFIVPFPDDYIYEEAEETERLETENL